jgi:4-hydroxy-3-methylbut-2-enyl diphosphate reductase
MGKVVAIDGPSGAGKSTIAKRLAENLGFTYLDTGALYRATALGLIRANIPENASDDEIEKALEFIHIEYKNGIVYLNSQDVEGEIRTTEMGHLSSVFSAKRAVRDFLLPVQQHAAVDDNLVAEGRDMTTVVFPNAWEKVYLDAATEARALRRFKQLKKKGIEIDMETATADVVDRDERDSSRDIAPLRKADDAFVIDSSTMEVSDVIESILDNLKNNDDAVPQIITAKHAGFCFGVRRAVEMAFELAEKNPDGNVVTLGPIIHNPQVVNKLKEAHVSPVDSIDDMDKDKIEMVLVRTHGIPEEDMQRLQDDGYEVIDATCPFVKKAQQYAQLLKKEGYKVVVLGDKEHPEVKGIMSYAGDEAVVVKDADEYPPLKGRVGIIVQTTKETETLKKILPIAIEHAKELKVYNTICSSTSLRQRETGEMADIVDLMLIVGGKNSANTTRLAKYCTQHGVTTYHIETSDELQPQWFEGVNRVGITAGASTPDWIINEIKQNIKNIGGRISDGHSE